MADIELMIKIPEEVYKASQVLDTKYEHNIQIPLEVLTNGIPLPKGHGDLKDFNNLKHAFIMRSMANQGNFTNADIASIVYNSSTIIESDKAESEDEE